MLDFVFSTYVLSHIFACIDYIVTWHTPVSTYNTLIFLELVERYYNISCNNDLLWWQQQQEMCNVKLVKFCLHKFSRAQNSNSLSWSCLFLGKIILVHVPNFEVEIILILRQINCTWGKNRYREREIVKNGHMYKWKDTKTTST